MNPVRRRWASRALRIAVCVAAAAYLYQKVSWYDHAALPGEPGASYRVLGRAGDDPLRLAGPGGVERAVANGPTAADRPRIELGLRSLVRHLRRDFAGWALVALAPTTFLLAWRLRDLLDMQGLSLSFKDATLLTFAGNFFNFALPGTTGGDLFKAYHIARIGHKRTEGVTIVFLDRVIGLVSFVLLAGAAIALSVVTGGVVIGRFGRLVGLMLAALVVAAMIFFSRRFRRWIGYEALLQRLPFADKLRRVDQTAFSFRYHPGRTAAALVVTAINHAFMALGVLYLARALGMPTDGRALTARTYLSFYLASLLSVTVGYLLAAVPVSFQGFGLLEAVFLRVLARGGWGTQSQVVALCLGTRVMQLLWALPGMIVPWLGLRRPGAAYETDVAAAEPATSPEARRADSV